MIALQSPELMQRVEQFARTEKMDETAVVETAVEYYLDQAEREKIHAETQLFWQMYEELQANYLGQYVAMREGRVVDHDHDVLQLEQRIVDRFGDIALLIAPVTASTRKELRRISFKLEPAS